MLMNDLTVWAIGVKIPDLEDSINSYLGPEDFHCLSKRWPVVEAEMLNIWEHSELLSVQYLARCLEPGNVCHSITTRETHHHHRLIKLSASIVLYICILYH